MRQEALAQALEEARTTAQTAAEASEGKVAQLASYSCSFLQPFDVQHCKLGSIVNELCKGEGVVKSSPHLP